jgi:hypothetical protein
MRSGSAATAALAETTVVIMRHAPTDSPRTTSWNG